ncbi:F-box protein At2g26850-like [Neltuma alba]|uniref:F-box protein At2g26850-like n=1 Tax=Neltuma alba TaxID=207710 RepID=UPI0010A5765F|nr:F-box protein At2g26850-like [Prosopis alba]
MNPGILKPILPSPAASNHGHGYKFTHKGSAGNNGLADGECRRGLSFFCPTVTMLKKDLESKEEKKGERKISLLDLPELTLQRILECLTAAELCTLAHVCSSLRVRCRSDLLWEKQIKLKWGKLIEHCKPPGNSLSEYSMMAWYFYMEKGKFWFPAQVYKSGDYMLCCYDALLSYNWRTNLFMTRSRYSGWRLVEQNISWERLRATPTQTPHVLHVSDCLNDLKPGDHIEVQWRSHKNLPYDWWYAIVGHLESCKEDDHCHCHLSDLLIIEFIQYSPGSHYRRVVLNKMNDGEQTDGGGGGLYGGIKKLHSHEIEKWKELWPNIIG